MIQSLQKSQPDTKPDRAESVYRALLEEPGAPESHGTSHSFLCEQLELAAQKPFSVPLKRDSLNAWVEQQVTRTAEEYADYLESRKAGKPRNYFTCRSHALFYLQRIAPTKLVDGAWLYGVLSRWADDRFYPLVRTYLEELGDGDPGQNHVVLYKRLLERYGCEPLPDLPDNHYLQGAVQLALGYHCDHFLPEVIGYNLGYEVLPLHMLISAFELDELGIDPYYFTLHVTVDNASTGHARKATQSVWNAAPSGSDGRTFLERVANGYRLNDLGPGAAELVDSFNLEQELLAMLERKSPFGRNLHSDFCSIAGSTVNEWLSDPSRVRGFLQALVDEGWIKRHQDPQSSRFWRLLDGSGAPMFGVFSSFEKQLIYDWIAGDWLNRGEGLHSSAGEAEADLRAKTIKRRRAPGSPECAPSSPTPGEPGNVDNDLEELNRELAMLPRELRMRRLINLMSPSRHASGAGLLATRLFSAALDKVRADGC